MKMKFQLLAKKREEVVDEKNKKEKQRRKRGGGGGGSVAERSGSLMAGSRKLCAHISAGRFMKVLFF